jgi:integrase
MYFSTEQFSTQTAVERHLEAFVLKLNCDNPTLAILEPTFDAVLDRFIQEERLIGIKKVRPGESCDNVGDLSNSTATSYLSVIKRIRVQWGHHAYYPPEADEGPGMATKPRSRTQDRRSHQGRHTPLV